MCCADIKKEKVVNSDGIEQVTKDIEEDGYKYVGVSEAHSFKEKMKKVALSRI